MTFRKKATFFSWNSFFIYFPLKLLLKMLHVSPLPLRFPDTKYLFLTNKPFYSKIKEIRQLSYFPEKRL